MTTSPTTRQPSPRALATASLTAAGRLGDQARRDAMTKHAEQVWTAKTCTMVGRTQRF